MLEGGGASAGRRGIKERRKNETTVVAQSVKYTLKSSSFSRTRMTLQKSAIYSLVICILLIKNVHIFL